jgi:hypothetical protein
MAKTINKDIDLFGTLSQAERAFNKTVSGDLLSAKFGKQVYYYIDRSKTAKIDWPLNYTLVKTK